MTIFKAGPCGGDGGQPRATNKSTHIVAIRVYHSPYINAITITYIVDDHAETVTWGIPLGELGEKKNEVENKTCYPILPGPFEQFTLQPDEYITSVKGYYGSTIDDGWNGLKALSFETSETIEPYAYGTKVGKEFSLPAINGKIIGFHGRSENRIDALGVYVKAGDTDGSTGTGNI